MDIYLDHTIVHARDPAVTAGFLSELLGIAPPQRLGHFTVLKVGPTSLDYLPGDGPIASRHFAFRVSEAQFDTIFDRVQARKIAYWADPFHQQPGAINRWDDGRGFYFDDPDGHLIEVLTRSYGSGGCEAEHPHPLLDCPKK
jgi:catechol 2,3-dioxygenase-like lactoylglutathione lyase family enzyme